MIAAAWQRTPLEIVTTAPAASSVSLPVRNPLSRPIEVSFDGRKQTLAPGATASWMLKTNGLRNVDPIRLRAALHITGVGYLTQWTDVVSTNPLRLIILPPVNGRLPLLIENPSGEAFSGSVMLAWNGTGLQPRSKRVQVAFTTGQIAQTVVSAWSPEEQKIGDPMRLSWTMPVAWSSVRQRADSWPLTPSRATPTTRL
jgi:hypothetical protein